MSGPYRCQISLIFSIFNGIVNSLKKYSVSAKFENQTKCGPCVCDRERKMLIMFGVDTVAFEEDSPTTSLCLLNFFLLKICQYCVNKIVDCAVCLLNPVILLALVIFQTKPPHCWTEHFVKKIAMTRVSHWLNPCEGINTFILLLQAYGIVSFLFATFPYCFCSGFVSPIVLNLPIDDAPMLLFILHFQFRNYKKPQNF